MTNAAIPVRRPERWDHPLDESMSTEVVERLLKTSPFCDLRAERFSKQTPLAAILQHDCRLLALAPGEILFQEGQYGGSAYLVLTGTMRVFLASLQIGERMRPRRQAADWISLAKRLVHLPRARPEQRKRQRTHATQSTARDATPVKTSRRGEGRETRLLLQDIPGVLSEHATAAVGPGELFGELAAVTRTPREYTAAAETECLVLEIRWQGLKLLKQDPVFRELLDERYRGEVLKNHLRETELFRYVPDESLDRVVQAAGLEQFGELEWYAEYRQQQKQAAGDRIAGEPLMAEEGSYATGLWIVRSGFARLSQRQGAGHRTLAYLGKGQIFGLQEIAHNARLEPGMPPLPYQESLRAIGYVDVVRVPKQVIVEHVLPYMRANELPAMIMQPRYQLGQPVMESSLDAGKHDIETGLLEFLVDQRLMNGQQAMMINMDRCTRCDDCVRACATTHQGSPVFERTGSTYGSWMFAHACMHCVDPVCMIGCPTGAIHRDHDSGLVRISEEHCIGCKTCAESCPYDNIRMVPSLDERGRPRVDVESRLPILQASKCDLCIDYGGRPACQSACPHDALVRIDLGNLNALATTVSQGRRHDAA